MKTLLLVGFVMIGACGAFATGSVERTIVLEKKADAATVMEQMGQPERIEKVRGSAGKAEKWIYRRQLNVVRVALKLDPNGNGAGYAQTAVPNFRMMDVTKYEVVALTLVEGRLESARRTIEQEEKFVE